MNEANLETWGRDKSIIGQNLHEAIPELKNQPFSKILATVYTTGTPYFQRNAKVEMVKNGVLSTCYFNFWYKPMFDNFKKVYGVLTSE